MNTNKHTSENCPNFHGSELTIERQGERLVGKSLLSQRFAVTMFLFIVESPLFGCSRRPTNSSCLALLQGVDNDHSELLETIFTIAMLFAMLLTRQNQFAVIVDAIAVFTLDATFDECREGF